MTITALSALCLGGVLALTASTFALPRHVSVERHAIVNAAPDAILTLAASNSGFQSFNPYKTLDPALEIELYGPEAGVGSGFRFQGKDGTGRQTVAEVTANKVVYQIDLGAMGTPAQSIATEETADGTRVTWRVDSDMGFNPAFRVFGLFMDGMMGPTVELGLENLAAAAA
ncbi:MAG: SRPBCC family protein [Pseudomonadota bacterium]